MHDDRSEERLTLVFRALADPTRRRILTALARREMSISELAEPFAMTLAGVLKHLKVLEEAGLIDNQKTGRVRHCRLEEGPLLEATVWLSRQSKYWQNQFETLAAFLSLQDKESQK